MLTNVLRAAIVLLFLGLAIWAIVLNHFGRVIADSEPWLLLTDALIDVAPELAGIVIGVVTIDYLNERRQREQLKAQLIRQMGMNIRDVAIPAARELEHHGWFYDNSLSGVSFYQANLSGADLAGINLSRADLWKADLSRADLWKADLSGANLQEADLSGARLWETNLSGANLLEANLSGAEIGMVNLTRANLGRANLSGAEFWSANLSGARGWTIEQLEQAISLEGTIRHLAI